MKTALTVMLLILPSYIQKDTSFNRLRKLEGTWKMETSKGNLYERWTLTNRETLRALSYKINNLDTVLLEEINLVKRADGIFYIPVVKGQNNDLPVPFKLIKADKNQFTFENKEHDFPQRIIYTFIKADSMVARIEGNKNGKINHTEFYFKKTD